MNKKKYGLFLLIHQLCVSFTTSLNLYWSSIPIQLSRLKRISIHGADNLLYYYERLLNIIYIHLCLESPSNNQNIRVYDTNAAHFQYLRIRNPTCSPRCRLSKCCYSLQHNISLMSATNSKHLRDIAALLHNFSVGQPTIDTGRIFHTSVVHTCRVSLIARHESTNILLTPGSHVGNEQRLTVK